MSDETYQSMPFRQSIDGNRPLWIILALALFVAIVSLAGWRFALWKESLSSTSSTTPPTLESILESLTPKNASTTPPSPQVLKSLTPRTKVSTPPSQEVLDSLTPHQK